MLEFCEPFLGVAVVSKMTHSGVTKEHGARLLNEGFFELGDHTFAFSCG